MEKIANDYLTIQVSDLGAELSSIKDENGREYLWQGDKRYWGRRSPILFPIVGAVWHDTFRVDGKKYHAKRHGFARDSKFKLIKRENNRLVYSLHDTAESYENYPFHFILGISYKLERNKIHVVWHVQNIDDKEIHFQIGGHPAFNIPDMKEGEPVKGYLKLSQKSWSARFSTTRVTDWKPTKTLRLTKAYWSSTNRLSRMTLWSSTAANLMTYSYLIEKECRKYRFISTLQP